jgi:cell wall-associated NlpC family hydrolase
MFTEQFSPAQTAFHEPHPVVNSCDPHFRCALLSMLAALVLAGCSSPGPAPRPTTPSNLGTTRPRAPIAPGAWKREADRWLGVRYRRGGTDRNGVDCSGLVLRLYADVAGLALPRTSQQQSRVGLAVATRDLRAGDLVLFSTDGRDIDHVGLCLGGTDFVHASPSKGVVVSSLRQNYYAVRLRGVRRLLR